MTTQLQKIEGAARALAEAKTLDDIKYVRDLAQAASDYARAAKLGLEAQNDAAEIKLRAERKAGELLAELERGEAGRPKNTRQSVGNLSEYQEAIVASELNERTAQRWQEAANIVEDDEFEEYIVETKEAGKELTSAGIGRVAQAKKRELRREEMEEEPLPPNKYRVLYADPPWRYNDSGVITDNDNYGRAERHYPTMSITELCALPVKEIALDNAVLFMWATSPLLEDAFKVINAWGFKYKTSFVWDKVRHNFGHYNSVRHELLLVCTKGSCTPDVQKLFDSVQVVERTSTHSEKPEVFREIIDTIYPNGNRVEMFARIEVDGWDRWGNE